MKIKSRFVCEVCGIEFDRANDCLEHEKTCGEIETFTCNCCGETRSWNPNDVSEHVVNESISHHIDLGVMGYGSAFDGDHVVFDMCDSCLEKLTQSFVITPSFLDYDTNYYELEEC
jgi:uncharacterized Zn-finger protein